MYGNRMADIAVRHRTLAPFGGITRIRFKGSLSPPLRNWTLSHRGSPAVYLFRIGLAQSKSTTSKLLAEQCYKPGT